MFPTCRRDYLRRGRMPIVRDRQGCLSSTPYHARLHQNREPSSKGLVVLTFARNNTSKKQFFRNFDRFAFLRCNTQISELKQLACLEKIISTLLFPDSHS